MTASLSLPPQQNIALIAAMDRNRVIGSDNQMPWHLPDDLRFFKATTLGKPVVMGRKTFESIGERPLPKRRNLVVSRRSDYAPDGVEVFPSIDAALAACSEAPEVMIIGGGELYRQTLPFANRLYVTRVDTTVSGDTLFPAWSETEWTIVQSLPHAKDEQHPYAFEFQTFERL